MSVIKPNAPMPACNARDQAKILDVIASFRGKSRASCNALVDTMGAKTLCITLHAMRRWYTANTGNSAKKILPHVRVLSTGMDLRVPTVLYRGFKVDTSNRLADLDEGDELTIPVTRNGGCSSWTLGRKFADKFSGASKGKVGLVVQLASHQGVKVFIAPPEHCAPWFNTLYAETMGRSHRHNEREYAIYAPRIRIRVVRVKRR